MLIIPANNGFWYDHGVELAVAIATFFTVAVAFGTIWYTVSKDRKNKKEDDEKTLYMLDLKTVDYRLKFKKELDEIKTSEMNKAYYHAITDNPITKDMIDDMLQSEYPNLLEDVKEFHRKTLKLGPPKIVEIINEYKSTIESILYNHYTNLSLESIKLLETKIELSKSLLRTTNRLHFFPKELILDRRTKFDESRITHLNDGLKKFNEYEDMIHQLSKKTLNYKYFKRR